MGFYDDAKAWEEPRRGPRCSVTVLLEELTEHDPDYAAELQQALDDPQIGPTAIWETLRDDGHIIGDGAVGRHKRGRCKCPNRS